MKKIMFLLFMVMILPSVCFAQNCDVTVDGNDRCNFDVTEYEGIAAPSVSSANKGIIYFDVSGGKFQCSEGGGAYSDCIGVGAGAGTECSTASCDLNVNTELNSQGICLADGTDCPAFGVGDLLANGTVPLSAAWDVGAYKVTALSFESDVATGTAPFIVASTTEVANLKSATATALAANPADCAANTYAQSIVAAGTLTCGTVTLASADFANQGTTTTVLHGNAGGNPAFGAIVVADTSITAGRSLTWSTNDMVADAELYTFAWDKTIETPTDADTFIVKAKVALASTITSIQCIVEDATSATIRIDECDVAGDNCAGIDGATTIVCDVGGQADDGSLSNAAIDAGDTIRMVVTATDGTPGHVTATIIGTRND